MLLAINGEITSPPYAIIRNDMPIKRKGTLSIMNAFETGKYRNVFAEYGINEKDVQKRLFEIRDTFFFGGDDERVYHEVVPNMAYIEDTGNNDVRTEGMSYGMMMAVQLDMKDVFDRLWKWAKTYMYMSEGFNAGYFAWSCQTDGKKNSNGPAPDGEEYFALALIFASHRWGDGKGIFDYSTEAKNILSAMIHKGSTIPGQPMFNNENHYILFVPGIGFTDPSYHLPHFYELFALYANEEDRAFFKEAAHQSRLYLIKACNEKTGFSAEYAEFDGTPMSRPLPWSNDRHDWFYSDSYRTVANIALDYEWFGKDEGQIKACDAIQRFLDSARRADEYHIYEIDGTIVPTKYAHHPTGLPATVAQASLAADNETTRDWVLSFYNMPLRTGKYRYYDNCLYFFAFLALSGNYRIW